MDWELGIQTDTLIGNTAQVTSFGTCPMPSPKARGEPGRSHGSPCFEEL